MKNLWFLILLLPICDALGARFTPLGGVLVSGDWLSSTLSISKDSSTIVGGVYTAASGEYRQGGIWEHKSTNFTLLGDLAGGILYSMALGTSYKGDYVVGESAATNGYEAFLWDKQSGVVGLGDLPGGSYRSQARGVSKDGKVAVGYSFSGNGKEAFKWTKATGMVGIGDLPGGKFESIAQDISDDGTVIVGMSQSDTGQEAMRWTQATGMVGLGFLGGGNFSWAWRISSDAKYIVGQAGNAMGFEGFLWSQEKGMVGLGWLPSNGLVRSRAYDVSNDAKYVVGSSWTDEETEVATIWDATNGLRSIKTLLEKEQVSIGNWKLEQARGISADGKTIIGLGINPSGKIEGWVIDL